MRGPKTSPGLKRSLIALAIVVFLFGAFSLLHPFRTKVRIGAETALAHVYGTPASSFPVIDTASLTPLQQKIISLSKQEYAKKPVSFDATVLKYSQGAKDPWCADYASWIMKEAGASYSNPNSGSWRIPGVLTLREYYQAQHRYRLADTYTPQPGDVAIYIRGAHKEHTNIVLSVHDGVMTTIGGNETGHLRVNMQSYKTGTAGLEGFGLLPSAT
jgi:hypothetical protein